MTARLGVLLTLGVLATPSLAQAQDPPQTFTVSTTANSGAGSLRAAITSANTNNNGSASDQINFALALNSQITVDTALPQITQRVRLNGCSQSASSPGRCVGVKPTTANTITTLLDVDSSNVTIDGIAWSGATGAAVRLRPNRTGFIAKRNHFGRSVGAAATSDRNAIGLLVEGDGATIGGTDGFSGNVFTNNTTALKILGGDNTVIQGNLFGVDITFSFRDANDEDIEIVGDGAAVGATAPQNTLIGGVPTAAQAASTECDGPCNVIGGADGRVVGRFLDDGDGVDLDGESSASELPAGDTTIQGNHIGLSKSGFSGTPESGIQYTGNRGFGIRGSRDPQPPASPRTITVGGDTPAAGNLIARNRTGGARLGTGAIVQGNAFGMSSDGTTVLPNRGADLSITGGSPVVRDNRFGGTPETRHSSVSLGSTVSADVRGNQWGVLDEHRGAALSLSESFDATIGGPNPGDANTFVRAGEPSIGALDIREGDGHTITGNLFGRTAAGAQLGNDYAGISIEYATNVTIGGATDASENVIAGTRTVEDTSIPAFVGGFGIELHDQDLTTDPETDDVTILRNRGLGNDRDFIDLNADGPGNPANGPNDGIQIPVIDGFTATTITGTALPGTVVLLFEPGAGGIERYIGTANTPASGRWTAAVGEQAVGEHKVIATQTLTDSTSELTSPFAFTITAPPAGGGPTDPGGDPSNPGGGPGGPAAPGGPNAPGGPRGDTPAILARAALNGRTATFTLKKVLRVGLSCPAGAVRCGGTLTVALPGRKPVQLGKLNIRLQPGTKTTVGWKIKRALVAKLRKRGAKVQATITSPTGNSAKPTTTTLKVKVEKKKR